MKDYENIEQFYVRNKLEYIPKNTLGHFNVFKRANTTTSQITYNKRDYFKITLLKGKIKINYADKTVQSDNYALMFSDPQVPYSWEPLEKNQDGYFCIFTESFFNKFGSIKDYPVFQTNQNKVFILDTLEAKEIERIYIKMFEEINSDYTYKDDVLKNLVFELIHYAMKMKPASIINLEKKEKDSKVYSLFNELLQRQFPLESIYERLELKTPTDYAKQLNIHTNHLNKVLKENTNKTTSQLIAQRVLEEAKVLLKHTPYTISEISFCLGFDEPSYFINFFKKRENITPLKYRKTINI
ncbi:helix-turn-helix domain-containing protein [Campylobacterota bacterium DY0563]